MFKLNCYMTLAITYVFHCCVKNGPKEEGKKVVKSVRRQDKAKEKEQRPKHSPRVNPKGVFLTIKAHESPDSLHTALHCSA